MTDLTAGFRLAGVFLLLGGFAVAAHRDWTTREVSDRLWQLLALLGAALGALALAPEGLGAELVWLIAAGFLLEHLFPWDDLLDAIDPRWPVVLEAGVYLLVSSVLVGLWWARGLGAAGVPPEALSVWISVLVGRGLFEAGLLYGGADAKGFMTAGILIPFQTQTLVPLPDSAARILLIYPFPITLLMNAAVVALLIPVGLAIRNLRAGEFEFPKGFMGYWLPTRELARKFVWLRDPSFDLDEESAETSEDDRRLREQAQRTLEARGIARVWVTPQIPFLVLMFVGAALGLLAGNLVLDLVAIG
ncbi:MAG TPA: hypothetical protein VGV64_03580 [Thermoplasmata archaeon]|nr:hypothetical protein [Thermoplasmata archaeon]